MSKKKKKKTVVVVTAGNNEWHPTKKELRKIARLMNKVMKAGGVKDRSIVVFRDSVSVSTLEV